MDKLKDNEFRCAICQNVYGKGWTDEEAQKEANGIWGGIPKGDMAVICDSCFNNRTLKEVKVMGEHHKSIAETIRANLKR